MSSIALSMLSRSLTTDAGMFRMMSSSGSPIVLLIRHDIDEDVSGFAGVLTLVLIPEFLSLAFRYDDVPPFTTVVVRKPLVKPEMNPLSVGVRNDVPGNAASPSGASVLPPFVPHYSSLAITTSSARIIVSWPLVGPLDRKS